MQKIVITKEYEGTRLDKVLVILLPDKTRTAILKLIEDGNILLNGNSFKASTKAKENDEITVLDVEAKPLDIEAKKMDLDIVYQDEDVAIINKPKGLTVHPGAGNYSDTLVNGLLAELDDLATINGVIRPGIVHRIDKDTSGLLMIAKNDNASLSLTNQLKEHTCKRRYYALVYGEFQEEKGRINAPIARDPLDRKKMGIVRDGKEAITNFTVIKRYKGYTLLECALETGRTHQIRVHMSYIGHPLVGDKIYGRRKDEKSDGQFLHAKVIGFKHPRTGEWMEFDSKLPEYFTEFLNTLEEL